MLKAAIVFGSNMVLQRQKEIKIWGTGTPGKPVTGRLKGKETAVSEACTAGDGNWMLLFAPQEAERGLELTITDGTDTLTFSNISIGEVWLAGGQSNMSYLLHFDAEKESALNEPANPDIRFFDYPEVFYKGQLEEHDYSKVGIWRKCTKEDLPYYSAAGYYFAKDIQEDLNIPIGIIGCNWGGTKACSWVDSDYLKDNEGKAWLEWYEEETKDLDVEAYKTAFRLNPANVHSDPLENPEDRGLYPGLTHEEQMGYLSMLTEEQKKEMFMPQIGPYHEWRPSGLYETMVKKVAPYTLRGVIWYQGEADVQKPEIYGTVFRKVIECWRDLWKEQLPFLFVQIPPFEQWFMATGERYPELRRQQELVAKTVPDTWMISSSDAGMRWDVHPKHKKPIGKRLALLARGRIYGENILCEPPAFLNAQRVLSGIRIHFKYADGLYLKGDKLNALAITDADGNEIIPVEVSVAEDGLLITGEFPEGVKISFARTGYYEVNLYNKENNPAKPFEVIV